MSWGPRKDWLKRGVTFLLWGRVHEAIISNLSRLSTCAFPWGMSSAVALSSWAVLHGGPSSHQSPRGRDLENINTWQSNGFHFSGT